MSLLRAFIAVDIPTPIRHIIQQKIDRLRTMPGASSVRWVSANNIHLTLKFLGDIPSTAVDGLTSTLRGVTDSVNAFDLEVGGLASFPSPRRARVLFIGIQAPAGLDALQQGIESACARLGYPPEPRVFSPHLTIGRIKQESSAVEQQKIRSTIADFHIDSLGTARVDSVHLYRSDLRPQGAVYTKLSSVPLRPVRISTP